jgi:mannose-6-phosphate isomerase class I
MSSSFRKTSQFLMPALKPEPVKGKYDIYPVFNIGDSKIFRGLETLADKIAGEKTVILDGFIGIPFLHLKEELENLLKVKYDIKVFWINVADFLKTEDEIDQMINPFLGGDDPVFGKRTNLSMIDFFSAEKLEFFFVPDTYSMTILFGTGAGLVTDKGFLVYFDLPKNELQFRSRAGNVKSLGARANLDPRFIYKRFYFVDWVVLGKYKQSILEKIDILADGQREYDITWVSGNDFRKSLYDLSCNAIRTRPWFEPGAWGGTWIKENIPGVNINVPNYAWSFELITPENGLIIESSGLVLEFSFDFLMHQEAEKVLGDSYHRFGTDFPLRFDFLDTFAGGNLSIQCHPKPQYMKDNFGEDFTQEETYYILDAKDDAIVYLGFHEDISKAEFRTSLKKSFLLNKPVEIDKYVQKHPSHKHDFFLIPYGTIHGSGINNLVLEISSTPYIFTFKMYDWLRPDLDGRLRPLNIERAIDNLYFERKGISVIEELISNPVLTDEGVDWKLFRLPTHVTHLYDVMRYHFNNKIDIQTRNKFHVLSLVDGSSISVEIPGTKNRIFNFAETFIIPASVTSYHVTNLSPKSAMLIIAYVK